MKAVFAFLFILLFLSKGFSQFETPKRVINLGTISNTSGQAAPTSPKAITYPSIFDKKDKLSSNVTLLNKKPVEEKSVFEKKQFDSPVKEYTDKMNNQMKSEGMSREFVDSDMYMGDFKIFTEKLVIMCRDNSAVDGDNVCIWLNGEKVVPFIGLEGGFKNYTFNLKLGSNTIQIEALNTGELFPNTGQFVFIDGNSKTITNQNWGLNTGYKAIVKIDRISGIEPTPVMADPKK